MPTCIRVARVAMVLSLPTAIHAQGTRVVVLRDPAPPSWDLSGHAAWLTVDGGPGVSSWNRWYDVAAVGASAGRFFGPYLKVEFDAATSNSADLYVERSVTVQSQAYPVYYAQPERRRMTTLSGDVSYQFFDNRWFHPVAGVGVEAARETRTIDVRVAGTVPPGAIPLEPPGTTVSWQSRPFATVGFKWYLSERGFIRSDVRTTFDGHGVAQLSWRTGFGVEF